ncbi:hypothetical protein SISSUDRAFT_1048913 [Sistotremastrum suecicum HHB10207 ss-3]|uniref:Uncharacterized protein n=1 Tax=Sistotremastrum suecicum HHB10207 ss-3 TaxID=1314776 RepID=A0A166C791_9AGAM|nr:hypothetical protein SISSUDRAFT_1048913 [Sistotremastrum suecicum HHB10207 ss-3]
MDHWKAIIHVHKALVFPDHNDGSTLDFVDLEDTRCLVVSEELNTHWPYVQSLAPYALGMSPAFGCDYTLLWSSSTNDCESENPGTFQDRPSTRGKCCELSMPYIDQQYNL